MRPSIRHVPTRIGTAMRAGPSLEYGLVLCHQDCGADCPPDHTAGVSRGPTATCGDAGVRHRRRWRVGERGLCSQRRGRRRPRRRSHRSGPLRSVNHIAWFGPDGRFVQNIGRVRFRTGEFRRPHAMTIDQNTDLIHRAGTLNDGQPMPVSENFFGREAFAFGLELGTCKELRRVAHSGAGLDSVRSSCGCRTRAFRSSCCAWPERELSQRGVRATVKAKIRTSAGREGSVVG